MRASNGACWLQAGSLLINRQLREAMAAALKLEVHTLTMMQYTCKHCNCTACHAHSQGQLAVEWDSTAAGT